MAINIIDIGIGNDDIEHEPNSEVERGVDATIKQKLNFSPQISEIQKITQQYSNIINFFQKLSNKLFILNEDEKEELTKKLIPLTEQISSMIVGKKILGWYQESTISSSEVMLKRHEEMSAAFGIVVVYCLKNGQEIQLNYDDLNTFTFID